jgi:hypothetical protein
MIDLEADGLYPRSLVAAYALKAGGGAGGGGAGGRASSDAAAPAVNATSLSTSTANVNASSEPSQAVNGGWVSGLPRELQAATTKFLSNSPLGGLLEKSLNQLVEDDTSASGPATTAASTSQTAQGKPRRAKSQTPLGLPPALYDKIVPALPAKVRRCRLTLSNPR